jgi:glycosyl hydrolase family 26
VLAGLLTGVLIASGATPAVARPKAPQPPKRPTLTAKVAPATVPLGEPATLVARLRPASKGVRLVVQRREGGRWVLAGRAVTARNGRAVLRLDTSTAGQQRLRVLRQSARRSLRAVSKPATITVVDADPGCTPRTPLVDPQATDAARCVAARLDRWQAAGAMAVGQQLNVSNQAYADPLTAVGGYLPVIGLDLAELVASEGYGFAVRPLDHVVGLAQQGAVLSVSWHPANPATAAPFSFYDRSWTALHELLQPTAASARFWTDFDAGMALFAQLQAAGVAVVFRPLHEANGDWFWWGAPDPASYRALWTAMQQRAAQLGVHNIIWAYSFNADTGDNTSEPVHLLPGAVDLAGLDSYSRPGEPLSTAGYAAVAARVPRMAFTEVGPYKSTDGSWDPAVISQAARGLPSPPAWSMFWWDDATGIKQLSSLTGAASWLAGCPSGFCTLPR